ncbi:hypothetical protein G5I_12161 [Acromyrmex echinatior]|uniref:Uncharacterized protein n=1 Tax=Acromyrmex echinatior TaxID=103372 RepID=F4X1K0_ACREC|nr:hypothetical protein G5I_12161 [Acromyrmex echinatior]
MPGRHENRPMNAACNRECNRSCCGAYSPPRDVIIAADQSTGRRRRNEDDRDQEQRRTEELKKNITTSRVPPYLAAFLETTTTRPGKTRDTPTASKCLVPLLISLPLQPRDEETHRPLPLTSTAAAAVISLPVHATVAGTPRSNKCYQRRCLRPAPKTSQPSRVNDVRPRGGNCPEAMQPPHSSADRATSDPPKPRDSRT